MCKKIFKANIECQSCDGTGLYSGMGESRDCAVVCIKCKGTGEYLYTFTYTPFSGRVYRTDIKRVFARTCGIKHDADDYTNEDGNIIEFSKGGASYKHWINGAELKPMKTLYCPKMWTDQKWNSETCKANMRCGNSISACPMHEMMHKCWVEFDTT